MAYKIEAYGNGNAFVTHLLKSGMIGVRGEARKQLAAAIDGLIKYHQEQGAETERNQIIKAIAKRR